jgi:riboflavin biosynthesis pyrimidine reductase
VSVTYAALLGPNDPPTLGLEAVLEGLSLPAGGERQRPYVLLNMVCTADGRATIDGRSGPIGSRGDRELFHGLRTLVDGVLIGASTLRVERYNRIVADDADVARRVAQGLSEQPLACVVSGSLALDGDIPLLADSGARVAILTPSEKSLAPVAAHVDYVRCQRDGQLDLGAALAEVRTRFGVQTLLCEGGPHLAGQMLAASLVDELFLTVAPKLASGPLASTPNPITSATAGDTEATVAIPVLSGPALEPPEPLELVSVLEADSYLFLRYRVKRLSTEQ